MPSRPKKCIVLAAALWLVVFAQRATAETCWVHWPTDCTTVQASSPQTILLPFTTLDQFQNVDDVAKIRAR